MLTRGIVPALGAVLTLTFAASAQEGTPLKIGTPSATVETAQVGLAEASDGEIVAAITPETQLRADIASIVASLGLSDVQSQQVGAIVFQGIKSRRAALDELGGNFRELSFRDKLKLKGEMDTIQNGTKAKLSGVLTSSQRNTLESRIKPLRETFMASRS